MVYYIQEPDTGAISDGDVSPSLSHIAERLGAFEISLLLRIWLTRQSRLRVPRPIHQPIPANTPLLYPERNRDRMQKAVP